ncbi:hypothetical protein SNEBB_009132 [Seison nebaliae]|nr:hypothetical protein SNEBB_009132 [Seison nebaliae]
MKRKNKYSFISLPEKLSKISGDISHWSEKSVNEDQINVEKPSSHETFTSEWFSQQQFVVLGDEFKKFHHRFARNTDNLKSLLYVQKTLTKECFGSIGSSQDSYQMRPYTMIIVMMCRDLGKEYLKDYLTTVVPRLGKLLKEFLGKSDCLECLIEMFALSVKYLWRYLVGHWKDVYRLFSTFILMNNNREIKRFFSETISFIFKKSNEPQQIMMMLTTYDESDSLSQNVLVKSIILTEMMKDKINDKLNLEWDNLLSMIISQLFANGNNFKEYSKSLMMEFSSNLRRYLVERRMFDELELMTDKILNEITKHLCDDENDGNNYGLIHSLIIVVRLTATTKSKGNLTRLQYEKIEKIFQTLQSSNDELLFFLFHILLLNSHVTSPSYNAFYHLHTNLWERFVEKKDIYLFYLICKSENIRVDEQTENLVFTYIDGKILEQFYYYHHPERYRQFLRKYNSEICLDSLNFFTLPFQSRQLLFDRSDFIEHANNEGNIMELMWNYYEKKVKELSLPIQRNSLYELSNAFSEKTNDVQLFQLASVLSFGEYEHQIFSLNDAQILMKIGGILSLKIHDDNINFHLIYRLLILMKIYFQRIDHSSENNFHEFYMKSANSLYKFPYHLTEFGVKLREIINNISQLTNEKFVIVIDIIFLFIQLIGMMFESKEDLEKLKRGKLKREITQHFTNVCKFLHLYQITFEPFNQFLRSPQQRVRRQALSLLFLVHNNIFKLTALFENCVKFEKLNNFTIQNYREKQFHFKEILRHFKNALCYEFPFVNYIFGVMMTNFELFVEYSITEFISALQDIRRNKNLKFYVSELILSELTDVSYQMNRRTIENDGNEEEIEGFYKLCYRSISSIDRPSSDQWSLRKENDGWIEITPKLKWEILTRLIMKDVDYFFDTEFRDLSKMFKKLFQIFSQSYQHYKRINWVIEEDDEEDVDDDDDRENENNNKEMENNEIAQKENMRKMKEMKKKKKDDGKKSSKKIIIEWLQLFIGFLKKNERKLTMDEDIHKEFQKIILRCLMENDEIIQKLSYKMLTIIMDEEERAILKLYEETFFQLIRKEDFLKTLTFLRLKREETTTNNRIDEIEETFNCQHRSIILPILIRVLCGKIYQKSWKHSAGSRDSIFSRQKSILTSLLDCEKEEIKLYFKLILQERMLFYLEGCLDEQFIVLSNDNLREKERWRKWKNLRGFIAILNLFTKVFGDLSQKNFLMIILSFVASISNHIELFRNGKNSIESSELQLVKTIRKNLMEIWERIFRYSTLSSSSIENDKSILEMIHKGLLVRMETFIDDNLLIITQFCRLIDYWCDEKKYINLLLEKNEKNSSIFMILLKLIQHQNIRPTVFTFVLKILLKTLDDRSFMDLLTPIYMEEIRQFISFSLDNFSKFDTDRKNLHILFQIYLKFLSNENVIGENESIRILNCLLDYWMNCIRFNRCLIGSMMEINGNDSLLIFNGQLEKNILRNFKLIFIKFPEYEWNRLNCMKCFAVMFLRIDNRENRLLLVEIFQLFFSNERISSQIPFSSNLIDIVKNLNAQSTKQIDIIDFENRLQIMKSLNNDSISHSSHLPIIFGNLLNTIVNNSDMAIVDGSILSIVTLFNRHRDESEEEMKNWMFKELIHLLNSPDERLRRDIIKLFSEMIENVRGIVKLEVFQYLNDEKKLERNIFELMSDNQETVSAHTLTIIGDYLKENGKKKEYYETITSFFIPFINFILQDNIDRLVLEKKMEDERLRKHMKKLEKLKNHHSLIIDRSLNLLTIIVEQMSWESYHVLLTNIIHYLEKRHRRITSIEIRIFSSIIDAFHFNIKLADESEEWPEFPSNWQRMNENDSRNIYEYIIQQLIPKLQISLFNDKENKLMVNMSIVISIVKLLDRLPWTIVSRELPIFISKLCHLLQSKNRSVRHLSQNILCRVNKYMKNSLIFHMIINELNFALNSGRNQLIVLGHTLMLLLDEMSISIRHSSINIMDKTIGIINEIIVRLIDDMMKKIHQSQWKPSKEIERTDLDMNNQLDKTLFNSNSGTGGQQKLEEDKMNNLFQILQSFLIVLEKHQIFSATKIVDELKEKREESIIKRIFNAISKGILRNEKMEKNEKIEFALAYLSFKYEEIKEKNSSNENCGTTTNQSTKSCLLLEDGETMELKSILKKRTKHLQEIDEKILQFSFDLILQILRKSSSTNLGNDSELLMRDIYLICKEEILKNKNESLSIIFIQIINILISFNLELAEMDRKILLERLLVIFDKTSLVVDESGGVRDLQINFRSQVFIFASNLIRNQGNNLIITKNQLSILTLHCQHCLLKSIATQSILKFLSILLKGENDLYRLFSKNSSIDDTTTSDDILQQIEQMVESNVQQIALFAPEDKIRRIAKKVFKLYFQQVNIKKKRTIWLKLLICIEDRNVSLSLNGLTMMNLILEKENNRSSSWLRQNMKMTFLTIAIRVVNDYENDKLKYQATHLLNKYLVLFEDRNQLLIIYNFSIAMITGNLEKKISSKNIDHNCCGFYLLSIILRYWNDQMMKLGEKTKGNQAEYDSLNNISCTNYESIIDHIHQFFIQFHQTLLNNQLWKLVEQVLENVSAIISYSIINSKEIEEKKNGIIHWLFNHDLIMEHSSEIIRCRITEILLKLIGNNLLEKDWNLMIVEKFLFRQLSYNLKSETFTNNVMTLSATLLLIYNDQHFLPEQEKLKLTYWKKKILQLFNNLQSVVIAEMANEPTIFTKRMIVFKSLSIFLERSNANHIRNWLPNLMEPVLRHKNNQLNINSKINTKEVQKVDEWSDVYLKRLKKICGDPLFTDVKTKLWRQMAVRRKVRRTKKRRSMILNPGKVIKRKIISHLRRKKGKQLKKIMKYS